MPSHSGTLQSVDPIPGEPNRLEVVIDLACGCRITRIIAADRVVETVDGEFILVGKYPCPVGHPVRPPRDGAA